MCPYLTPEPHTRTIRGRTRRGRIFMTEDTMSVDLGGVKIENAEEKFVEMSHGTTRYIEAGDGYPTLLVHGVGYTSGAHDWALNIGPLSSRLRVIAVDALAWGKGEGWLEQEYSFAYLVDFLREFQDALGLEKTNLVGHSMGGWLASLFGYESPHRLNKLVLVASGGAMPRQLPSMVQFQPPSREQVLTGLNSRVNADVDLEAMADYHYAFTHNQERLAAYQRVLNHMNNMETRQRYNTVRRFRTSRSHARGLGPQRLDERPGDGRDDPCGHPGVKDGGPGVRPLGSDRGAGGVERRAARLPA